MARLIGVRLVGMFVVLLLLTFAVFVIQAKLPADPVAVTLGGGATPQLIAEKRHELGYDKPLWVQYERFLGRLVRGDLGTSLRTRSSVAGDIAHFAPATAELAVASAVWIFIFSLALGVWSALRRYGSGFARLFMLGLASAPTFFLAILFILLFYSHLHWLPASGESTTLEPVRKITGFLFIDAILRGNLHVAWDAVRHLILPSLVIALGPAVSIARVMRGSLIDTMRLDHIRTARSKGLTEVRVILKHALRNSLTPVLAMTGLQVGLLLTGVIVVETVFAWPGLGPLYGKRAAIRRFPGSHGRDAGFRRRLRRRECDRRHPAAGRRPSPQGTHLMDARAEPATALAAHDVVARVTDLHVTFPTPRGEVQALRGVSLEIARGEIVAIVGESGSGKTMFGLSLLGLLPASARPRVEGSVVRCRRRHARRSRTSGARSAPAMARGRVSGSAHVAEPDDADRRAAAGARDLA